MNLARKLPNFLHPAYVMFWVCIPTLLHSYLISESEYHRLWNVEKFLQLPELLVMSFCVLCFILGTYASSFTKYATPTETEQKLETRILDRVMWAGVILVIIANIIWYGMAVKNGFNLEMANESLNEEDTTIDVDYLKKEVFQTIPGVTTATQFALAATVMASYLFLRIAAFSIYSSFARSFCWRCRGLSWR